MKTIRVSELFASFQGEGRFTGMPSLWIRLFGCNLECNGFGQDHPTDPKTHVLPYKTINIDQIKSMKELPVFPYGCDSSYSWSSKFKSLAENLTADEIVQRIDQLAENELGISLFQGWTHPVTRVKSQLCFTGGEPMLQQRAINDICESIQSTIKKPPQITIETNATQPIKDLSITRLTNHVHMSCSPKLYSVSGERNGINIEVIRQYINYADSGCLKFVHNGSDDAWDELAWATRLLSPMIQGLDWDIWVMPVGATIEEQGPDHISAIATEALKRGYAISMRAHVYAFGNEIGR